MRKAFTLMEMMISVVLIVLITLFLSESITSLQRSNISLKKHDDVEHNRSVLFNLLYKDILSAKDLHVLPTKDRRFHIIQMQTLNSFYSIAYPYVTYYVNSNTFSLIRLESAYPIHLPISYERRYNYKAHVLASEVSDFNLYLSGSSTTQSLSKNTKSTPPTQYKLLYFNAKSLNEPIVLEISTP